MFRQMKFWKLEPMTSFISNIPEISKYSYSVIDPVFIYAMTSKKEFGHIVMQKKIMPKVLAGTCRSCS
jgi:hypothetical protein